MASDVSVAEATEVYDILARYCGAPESGKADFILHQTSSFVSEYRFIGSLGFGGKIYRTDARGRWRVSCYREDETPERLEAMIYANDALLRVNRDDRREKFDRVNAALKELWAAAEEAGLMVLQNDDQADDDDGTPQIVLTLEGAWPDDE